MLNTHVLLGQNFLRPRRFESPTLHGRPVRSVTHLNDRELLPGCTFAYGAEKLTQGVPDEKRIPDEISFP